MKKKLCFLEDIAFASSYPKLYPFIAGTAGIPLAPRSFPMAARDRIVYTDNTTRATRMEL